MDISQNIVLKLNETYRVRRARNPAYSLRSFSRDLKMNSGRLSQYFNGTRAITAKAGLKIMNQLGLSPREQAEWMGMTSIGSKADSMHLLQQKDFELITEPIHFTLLSLIQTKSFRQNTKWIARRTRTSAAEVIHSIQLLKDLGFIKDVKGKWTLSQPSGLKTSDGVRNAALIKAHQLQLKQTAELLGHVAIEFRDVTSITIPADIKKLAKAREMISDLRVQLAELLETGDTNEVYRLQIQLIPLTDLKNGEKHE